MNERTEISLIPVLKDISITPKNDMLILNFSTGEQYKILQDIMAPTVHYYGYRHHIDTLVKYSNERLAPERPAAWDKIVLIRNLLEIYKTVMWIDCDAIICNPIDDIRTSLEEGYPIHISTHNGIPPNFPNTGVMVLHHDDISFELLEEIWKQEDMINHPWWEQGALIKLLGYEHEYHQNIRYHGPTKYTSAVATLDLRWNCRPPDKELADNPAIIHFCGLPVRRRISEMKKQYSYFIKHVRRINHDK
jgi:hypothetical protein